MKKIFVNMLKEDEITREIAKGYKKLVINADTNDVIKFQTEDNELYIEKEDYIDEDDEEFCYVILCNEFGILGLDKGFKSKINVMFLDKGYMLITLKVGELLIMDEIMKMYSTVETVPQIRESKSGKTNILWVNASYLMSYLKKEELTKDKSKFIYDIEYCIEIGGTVETTDVFNSEEQFEIKSIEEEDIDLSLGQYAKYLQEKEKKEKGNEIDLSEYEYDEEEEEEDEEDYDVEDIL